MGTETPIKWPVSPMDQASMTLTILAMRVLQLLLPPLSGRHLVWFNFKNTVNKNTVCHRR